MIKRWFGEFFKNLVTMMKKHRSEKVVEIWYTRGSIPQLK